MSGVLRKSSSGKNKSRKSVSLSQVNERLDQKLPVNSLEWVKVEQQMMKLLEFAPVELLFETATAIAFLADAQARRGYLLGREDLLLEKLSKEKSVLPAVSDEARLRA